MLSHVSPEAVWPGEAGGSKIGAVGDGRILYACCAAHSVKKLVALFRVVFLRGLEFNGCLPW